jgi:hypothetical protein
MLDSHPDGMNFFTPPGRLVLHSHLSPDECARRLNQAIDIEEFALFSFSGYRGVKPFLGEVTGWKFRVFKRRYRNTFPPVLSGLFLPWKQGTRVEGIFDLELTSKIAICIFSLFGVLVTIPIVVYSLRNHTAPVWMALVFAGAFVTLAAFAPRIMRDNGRDQERDITDFLRTELETVEDSFQFESGRQS